MYDRVKMENSKIGPHEKFHLVKKGPGKYAFRTAFHFFIQANGNNLVRQFYDGPWETFSFTEYSAW